MDLTHETLKIRSNYFLNKSLAPIVLFVYNRPWHTIITINSLKKNYLSANSNLYIYSDHPKNASENNKVKKVRSIIKSINGFNKIEIICRNRNYGLANSIINGVTEIVNRYGKIIVLEDDMVTSPYFLDFMNEGLDKYSTNNEIASIHGYSYPISRILPETYFLRGADCWGWATWKRNWDKFNKNGSELLHQLRKNKMIDKFDINGSVGYTKMLKKQIVGLNDSWAIRWHASMFLKNKLTLYPGRSLVKNIGLDASGEHCNTTNIFDVNLSNEKINIRNIPVIESNEAYEGIKDYFRSSNFLSSRVKERVKQWLPPVILSILKWYYKGSIRISGPYLSWEEASNKSSGYDDNEIFRKVSQASILVKNGQVAYERDSVVFSKFDYSWPLLSALMWVASQEKGSLRVLDFGGSLGSSYFQNRNFTTGLNEIKWGVVEQNNFVQFGKDNIEGSTIKFFNTISECAIAIKPNVILLSSVLQYLEKPYEILKELKKINSNFMIIDRTPFTNRQDDIICIQHVPKSIYKASYPLWLFSKMKFISAIESSNWRDMVWFDSPGNIPSSIPVNWEGAIFVQR